MFPYINSLQGNSSRGGDASPEVKSLIAEYITYEGIRRGFSPIGVSFMLGVTDLESGFNPSAASKYSSAKGLGQFIDQTARGYGIDETERFSITENVRAMYDYMTDCLKSALTRFRPTSVRDLMIYGYGLYHDGPSLKYGGMQIAEDLLLPRVQKFINQFQF
jgi:hypothetical protein